MTPSEGSLSRRRALQLGVAAGAGLAVATAEPAAATAVRPSFLHGVASGDPLHDSVIPNTLDTGTAAAIAELVEADAPPVAGAPYNVDQWDGYPAERAKVLAHLRDREIRDTVFLTGDIHSGWACDLPVDGLRYPVDGNSVGVELVCTSVTSDNLDDITMTPPRSSSLAVETAFKANNPHIKYLDFDSHGYSVLEVTPAGVQMDWYTLIDRTDRNSAAVHSVSYRVPAGTQKVQPARGRLA